MYNREFTPGPWEVCSGMVQTVAEHNCKTPGCGVHIPIAYMDREAGNGTMPVERDANAYLIAAAPEMFELLQDLMPKLVAHGMRVQEIENVLAKAEKRRPKMTYGG